MSLKPSTRRTLNILYIIVTTFFAFRICGFIFAFLGTVSGIFDAMNFLPDTYYCFNGLLLFVFNMLISGIVSFYNKTFSRISFILGLIGLAAYVLWYNYIILFRPDLYIIIP